MGLGGSWNTHRPVLIELSDGTQHMIPGVGAGTGSNSFRVGKLVYVQHSQLGANLFRIPGRKNSDTDRNPESVLVRNSSVSDLGVRISPDANIGTDAGIWSVPPNGGKGELILDRPVEWWSWDPVEDGIYYLTNYGFQGETGDTSSQFRVEFYAFETDESELLFQGEGHALGLGVSPEEEWIYFSLDPEGDTDLMLLEFRQ